jgi:hypothetical protein
MNKDETVKKNISLAFDLLREIIKTPALGEKIPNGATVVFVEKDQTLTKKETARKNNKFIKVKRKFEIIEEKTALKV